MTSWFDRPIEEKALLNPAFCASLIWHFATAGGADAKRALTMSECYLVLPIILSKSSRESLPRSTRTSLAVWLDENSSFQATLSAKARAMIPFTREALIFGGSRDMFTITAEAITANLSMKRKISAVLKHSSAETQACMKKASFLGSWFIECGSSGTVMALLGVRP